MPTRSVKVLTSQKASCLKYLLVFNDLASLINFSSEYRGSVPYDA